MKTLRIWLLVSWRTLMGNIPVEKLEALLEGDAFTPISTEPKTGGITAVYPAWVDSHLTPKLETRVSNGVANPKLVLHPKQIVEERITGDEVYKWLIGTDQLSLCIELADLQWWEQHPNEIPEEFKGKLIYAWESVVLDGCGGRCVPYLCCGVYKPFVIWYRLDGDWDDGEPACLRAS